MRYKFPLAILCISIFCTSLMAQKYGSSEGVVVVKEWNGISFSSEMSLAENVSLAPNFEKLSAILKEVEDKIVTEDFMGTVFISVDTSYNSLTEEELEALFADSAALERFFKYYVVPGRLDAYSLKKAIEKNGGVAKLKTLHGENLSIKIENGQLSLFDMQNNTARIIASDFYHKNGLFHIVEGLVFPNVK